MKAGHPLHGLDDEIRDHLERETQENIERGMAPEEARRRARVKFGNIDLAREDTRQVWVWIWLEQLVQDLRYALRAFRRSPGFTVVAILTLAFGIGANTAIFSLIDSLTLRRLPVEDPGTLVRLTATQGAAERWSYPVWEQIREQPLFEDVAAWSPTRFDLALRGEQQLVDGLWASGSFFQTVGIPAVVGRTFSHADDHRDGGPDGRVVVISFRFWQRQFAGARNVIGRSLTLNGVPFTIVGVTPRGFFGLEVGRTFDVAVPLETNTGPRNAFVRWLGVVGRLKSGDTLEAVVASLRGIQPQIRDATLPSSASGPFRETYLQAPLALRPAARGSSRVRRQYAQPLFAIMVIVGLVLIVACANLANLQLAQGLARRHEFSLRLALGASRWRLARQVLVESLFLATTGVVLGILIAWVGSHALVEGLAKEPDLQSTTVFLDLSLHWHVLLFAIVAGIVTTVLFGVAPAVRATDVVPIDALKDARGTISSMRPRLSSGLVVEQLALSVVLVVGAGLFVRTFTSLLTRPLGFDPDRVLVATVSVQRAPVDAAQRMPIFQHAAELVSARPNVGSAAASLVTPISGLSLQNQINVSGATMSADDDRGVLVNHVSPGYFRTLDTPLLAGRDFAAGDGPGRPSVAIVNEAFARTFFEGASPLGHHISGLPVGNPAVPIVGVVGDAVYQSLRDPAPPTVYLPFAQSKEAADFGSMSLSVRPTSGSASSLIGDVTAALKAANPDLSWTFRPLADQIGASITQERITAMLAGFFGTLALLLAGLGLYGVTAYGVNRRRSEIGLRMALGASPARVVQLVVSRVAVTVGVGAVAGVAASLWLAQFVTPLLYGLDPQDPATLVGAVGVLVLVGLGAAALPAVRAARTAPTIVLREN